MSAHNPPKYHFDNINFNANHFNEDSNVVLTFNNNIQSRMIFKDGR